MNGLKQKTHKLTDLLDPKFMARLDGLDVVSRKMLHGRLQGERRSKRRGQSVEFADHRPYVVGDDLRFVDWNVYGRLGQLFLKLFQEELDLTVHVAFDASLSMGQPTPHKYRFVRQLASALGYVSLVHNNRVTVSAFADRITGQVAHARGRGRVPELAELMMTVDADGPSLFDAACKQLVASTPSSGVMLVISDFLFKEGYESGLKRMIGRGHDLFVVQTLAPEELDPPLSGDLKLVDIEDGDLSEVTVSSALIKQYKRNVNAYCNDLKAFCTRHGAAYILASTNQPVDKLVLNTLRLIHLLQ
ncbi:MAG: DUF58 domain-containing protein [Planctomycetes bacterium]|nr:DUF58 domain-containing protein [Planctomycetota bacterium]